MTKEERIEEFNENWFLGVQLNSIGDVLTIKESFNRNDNLNKLIMAITEAKEIMEMK